MRSGVLGRIGLLAVMVAIAASPARASFHLMQIEQVIGGINGDTGQQAIQLRARIVGQTIFDVAQLVAYDANGQNPVVLIQFLTTIPVGNPGSRILVVSPALAARLPAGTQPDFVMTNPIPPSYLAAGRITFEAV